MGVTPSSLPEFPEALRDLGWSDLPGGDAGRLTEITREFVEASLAFQDVEPAITIFGSARLPETHRAYALARETARLLALEGFNVVTGGGPGIMEAANRGCQEGGGVSIGVEDALEPLLGKLLQHGTISPADRELIHRCVEPEEAVRLVVQHHRRLSQVTNKPETRARKALEQMPPTK